MAKFELDKEKEKDFFEYINGDKNFSGEKLRVIPCPYNKNKYIVIGNENIIAQLIITFG